MKIKSVRLENIRSHVKTTISFTDGFNCLVGGLGTGKSSVLYAIDFALFGEPLGRSYDYLLREDEDKARVILQFSANGKEYAIIRALKRVGNRIVQDMDQLRFFEDGELVAELKSDAVMEQLFSAIGVDKDLFRRLIWIRQEHLKDILNMTAGERQRSLDQLFGLSDYETAWSNLRAILRWYESERNSLERDPDIIRMDELKTRYKEAVSELKEKKDKLEEDRAKLLEAKRRLDEITSRLDELQKIQMRNEELMRRKSELQARISASERILQEEKRRADTQKRRIDSLEREWNSLRGEENVLRKRLVEIELPRELTVDQLKMHLEALQDRISDELGREEAIRSEIKRASQRVSSLAEKSECPLCLQELSPEYKSNLMRKLYDEISENKQKLKHLEEEIRKLEGRRNVISDAIYNLQMIEARMRRLNEQILSERKILEEAQRKIEGINGELSKLRSEFISVCSQIREIEASRIEEIRRERDSILAEYNSLESRVRISEENIKETSKRIQDLKERIESAEKKASRLETVRKIIELIHEIRRSYRSIQPKLRREFIFYLERTVQRMLDELMGDNILRVRIDENYTPIIEGEAGRRRSVTNLSGGERTLLAFAYQLGIANLLIQLRTGRGLQMLILDEPTESLGREDGSISRLAEALSRLKTIEQIIAVTHSEEFADKADHVIWLRKEDNRSIVSS